MPNNHAVLGASARDESAIRVSDQVDLRAFVALSHLLDPGKCSLDPFF